MYACDTDTDVDEFSIAHIRDTVVCVDEFLNNATDCTCRIHASRTHLKTFLSCRTHVYKLSSQADCCYASGHTSRLHVTLISVDISDLKIRFYLTSRLYTCDNNISNILFARFI